MKGYLKGFKKSISREEPKERRRLQMNFASSKLRVYFLLLFFTTIAVTAFFPALAEEKKTDETVVEKPAEDAKKEEPAKDPAGRFAPDFCDFEMTFPEAPLATQRCTPTGECYTLYSYTMVYDLQTTVDISVNCTPSTPANYKRYTQGVMKAALAGMIENRGLDTYDINFSEEKTTKSAAVSGTGKTGMQGKIYTAQLWVGQNSVFSVQAELIGDAHPQADESFSTILKSLKTKEGKPMVIQKKVPIPSQGKNQ